MVARSNRTCPLRHKESNLSRSVQEIQDALTPFVAKWRSYSGTERSGSQTFLNELVAAYTGQSDVADVGARFDEFGSRDDGSGFMDLYWADVVIIEMKSPNQSRRLDQHRAQALDYWRNSADRAKGIAAPQYLVLCSFQNFEIWEPGKYPNEPVDKFYLEDLVDRVESLLFLTRRAPMFGGNGLAVSQQAAQHMVTMYDNLLARNAAEPEEIRRFTMQTVWALFAEDIGLLDGSPIENLSKALLADARLPEPTRGSEIELAGIYERFNISDPQLRNRGATSVPYINGELFASTPKIHLNKNDLEHLVTASEFNWRYMNPAIFGALLEGCLGQDRRWELGAHYTSEPDIMKIVGPVIVRPWVERIESAASYKDALALHAELLKFRIIDPAMGCGNFLAIAYREMRNLDLRLQDRIRDLAQAEGRPDALQMSWYSIKNLYGIEIEPFAVEIAKVTLWMTHAIESRRHNAKEQPLPLPVLDNLVCGDSLKIDWPEVDVIIGNPPFHGDRNLRGVLGGEYIDWLTETFNVGVKDYCVYFFLRTQEILKPGQRAGLVATKTISQTKNRDASLVPMTESGSIITDAVSTQKWSGDAAVHVSIICWQKPPITTTSFTLDGEPVEGITPSLKAGTRHRTAIALKPNTGICFQGFLTRGMGFVLEPEEAEALIKKGGPSYESVVVPFLNGRDVVTRPDQSPSRWVIDFADMPLEQVERDYPSALAIIRERVLPDRKDDPTQMQRWWQFWNTRKALRSAVMGMERFAVSPTTAKRLFLVWADPNCRPSHACNVFAFDDDYRFGVCSSRVHEVWARTLSSTLEDRLRYTPSTAFVTFPFPEPSESQRDAIAIQSREIVELRTAACETAQKGLTKVYNTMDEGGFTHLRAAHDRLDAAVLKAYGFPSEFLTDHDALIAALYDLNIECASNSSYDPFSKQKR